MVSASFLLVTTLASLVAATNWDYFANSYVDLSASIPRIIGGDEALPHSYPYIVGLMINGNSFCGGSLISKNYVLTAAHCGVRISSVEVILGAHNITADESTQIRIPGVKVINHENYNATSYQNDIAIIKLKEPVDINEYIQLAKLPSKSDVKSDFVDETVTSIGWGLFKDVPQPNLKDMSPNLRYVDVLGIEVKECGDYYNDLERNIVYVTENNVCTSGHRNKGTCNGDSGGPLLYNGVQVGIVSIGSTLCEICSPSIFTKVSQYLEWIADNSDVVIS